jgi:hypothetical protein
VSASICTTTSPVALRMARFLARGMRNSREEHAVTRLSRSRKPAHRAISSVEYSIAPMMTSKSAAPIVCRASASSAIPRLSRRALYGMQTLSFTPPH